MKHWLGSLNLRLALILLLALVASYSLMTWFFQTRLIEARVGQMAASVAAQVRQVEAELKAGSSVASLGPRLHQGDLPPRIWKHGGGEGPGFRDLPESDRGGPSPHRDDPSPRSDELSPHRDELSPHRDEQSARSDELSPRSEEVRPMARDLPLRVEAAPPDALRKIGPRRDPLVVQMHVHLSEALDLELGRKVEFHFAHSPSGPGLWVRLAGEPQRWLWAAMPFPAPERWSDGLLVIPAVGFVLAFVAALFLVVQVNRPLRRLGAALALVGGQGEPKPLPAEGSSEIRALTDNFNAMLGRLKRLESDRTTMLAGIAHDLRTPITRLQLQIELAGGERKDAMLRELAQMSEIFDQFRLFAGGGQGERTEARDLGLLLEELAEPWCEQGLALDLRSGLTAVVKPAALRRAVGNLLDNAFAYGAKPISLSLRSRGEEILVEIRDHGRGIPEAEIAEAMKPFARLDPARGGNGHSGLGLAIVERLVADMSGRLELENCLDTGLLARIILPRSRA